MSTVNPAGRSLYRWNKAQGLHGPGGEGFRAEARAADKKVACGRQEIMSGLSAAEKSKMASFMGAVNTKARNMLEEVVRLIASPGKDPRMLMKKVLVHACANLDVDRCIPFLEAMLRLGQDTALQLLWLYERYTVPNAGGGMTKCAADHFGRDLGVGKIEDILGLPDPDKKTFALQLSSWHPDRRVKVLRAWEATDPKMTADFLLDLIREEQARGGGDTGTSWVCSLCPIKREVEIEAKLLRGEHRRKDRTINAGVLYNNDSERIDVYRSPHESLFTLEPLRETYLRGRKRQDQEPRGEAGEKIVGDSPALEARNRIKASGATRVTGKHSCTWGTSRRCHEPQSPSCLGTDMGGRGDVPMPLTPMYAGRTYDPRRLCWSCTAELRGAIIFHGHDLELWHKVDDERRELMEIQRRNDLLKAQWARQEREERQVAELLRFIWEANLDSFSRHTLKERERVACSTKSEIGQLLDLKLSSQAAVKGDAAKDEGLKRLNQKEAKAWASILRLKASLNMDSRYASLDPGLLPASFDKRHNISTKRSDFLADGTPVTPQGAKQAFGRAETAADDTTGDICCWRSEAREKEKLLDRHREVHASQLSCEKRARFSQLCRRWMKAAKRVEEKQRHKHMLNEMGREKRMREREAAKLEKTRQLDEFRSATEARIAQEELYRREKDNEVKEEKRQESQELEMMKQEEAAQLAGGDRYWGLIREIKRLRDIEQERRLAWEARIRETREKLVATRCISKLSYFSHSNPPKDPDLARRIEALAAK